MLILDNGAYEGQKDWKRLLDMLRVYNPQICALPDYLLGPWEQTLHEAITFLDEHFTEFPSTRWMFIPQARAGDIMGYIDGLFRAIEDPRISWVGLSRALPLYISQDPLMRVNIATQLRKRWHGRIHALGMMRGSVGELRLCASAGVTSMDSNAPVWRGLNGFDLSRAWTEIPIDYDADIEYAIAFNDHIVLTNLEECGVDTASLRARGDMGQSQVVGG